MKTNRASRGRFIGVILIALLIGTTARESQAALITSFESPVQADGTATTGTSVPGFTGAGSSFMQIENPSGRYANDADAGVLPDLPGTADGRQLARIVSPSTNLNASLTSNAGLGLGLFDATQQYTLTVAIGNPFANANQFNGAIIELFAGATLIATNTLNSLTNAASFADLTAVSNGSGTNRVAIEHRPPHERPGHDLGCQRRG